MPHRERPNTMLECCLVALMLASAGGSALWLWRDIQAHAGDSHIWRFVGIGVLAIFALYLLWLLWALLTVAYALADDALHMKQAWQRTTIPLDGSFHLHRWRARWAWGGAVQQDLGVDEIALLPPIWVGRPAGSWVAVYRNAKGEPRAIAFRPSPQLLAALKAVVAERRAG